MKITDRTWELALPVAEELGLTLWDVKYVKEGASWFLRIIIDKEEGVNITDCEDFTHAFNPILDEHDYIADSYYFEVSSPGLGRELSRPEHFAAMLGEDVRLKLYKAKDGSKEWTGRLVAYEEEYILDIDGEEKTFAVTDVAKAFLADDNF